MLYTLKVHKTQNILSIRPKQSHVKPFALTFQKPIDAALLYSEINERRFKASLEFPKASNQTKLIFNVEPYQYNPNFQLDNWCTQIDNHLLEYSARVLGHDIFIAEDIHISDKVVLKGFVHQIQSGS